MKFTNILSVLTVALLICNLVYMIEIEERIERRVEESLLKRERESIQPFVIKLEEARRKVGMDPLESPPQTYGGTLDLMFEMANVFMAPLFEESE